MNKKLGLAGLVFILKALSAGRADAYGIQEQVAQEQAIESPKKIETITVQSERSGYEGIPYSYNVLDNLSAVRTDNQNVFFLPRWFYDMNNNGKIDSSEILNEAMSDSFNDAISNVFIEQLRKDKKKEENKKTELEPEPELEPISSKDKPINYTDILDILNKNKMKKINYTDILNMIYSYNDKIERLHHNQAIKRANLGYQPSQISKKKIEMDHGLHLILGFNEDTDFNALSGYAGVRYSPIKSLGVAGLLNFTKAGDENLESITTEPSITGRYGEGSVDETNSFAVGLSAELQAGIPIKEGAINFILGGGFNYWNSIETTVEKIMQNELILKSNTNSIPKSQIYGNIYGGIEAKFKKFSVGAIGGYDGKKGAYFGPRATIRLNRPRESKK